MTYIFVYNADASLFSQLTDFAHKIISPDTYECNLCKITYGNVAMKTQWKDYIASLDTPVTFLHRDEFIETYPEQKDVALPAMFVEHDATATLAISAADINAIESIDELIGLVDKVMVK